MEKSDAYLVERCRAGDTKSFELLVIKYQKRIFNVIFRIVNNKDVVEDLAQEAFLNAYKSIKNFKGHSSFYTWLYRIAVNVSLNHISVQKKAVYVDDAILDTEAATIAAPSFDMTPERGAGNSELSAAISAAVARLPDDIKTAIVFREYEGLSYEEIAEITECPIGTVRSRIFRGRAILQEMLKDYI